MGRSLVRRRDAAVLGAAAAATLTYAVLCAVEPGRPSTPVVVGSWIAAILACSAVSVVAAISAGGTARWAFAVAVNGWTAGECVYVFALGDEVSYPSAADPLYLLFYPAAYIGLGLQLRARVRAAALPASTWLDGLIALLAGGSLVAWLAVEPLALALGGEALTVATNLAYVLGDLLLVLLAGVLLVLTRRRAGTAWLLLLGGFCAFGVTDTAYLVLTAAGTYTDNTLVDPGWAVGLLMIAAAGLVRGRGEVLPFTAVPAAVPVVGGLVALMVLAGEDLHDAFAVESLADVSPVGVGLAVAAVVVTFVRLVLSLRETRQLVGARTMALTDELTLLPNRRALLDRLDTLVAGDAACALVLLDLDGFKDLNDTLGHPAGDELLRRVGARLHGASRSDELFARLGGDEFALVVPGAGRETGAGRARDLLAVLGTSVVLDGVPVRVGASAGVAAWPGDAADAPDAADLDGTARLLQAADVSMYQAKRSGGGVRAYRASDDPHSRDRLAMAAELVEGIAGGQLRLLYQPQVRTRDRAVVGAEALVRWQHPVHGLLTPDRFLPVVAATGVMRQLTDAVLTEAARQAVAWRRLGVSVAVNLSGSDMLDPALPHRVAAALEAAGASPRDLRLEVTEDAIMGGAGAAVAVLEQLRSAGLHLSLDDFGQGHSSLARLRDLPVDELKIDKAFVWRGPDPGPRTTSVVRAAVALARDLGLTVVAEGLEDDQVRQQLDDLGCDAVQGYAISRPVTAPDFERWHRRWTGEERRPDVAATTAKKWCDPPRAASGATAPIPADTDMYRHKPPAPGHPGSRTAAQVLRTDTASSYLPGHS